MNNDENAFDVMAAAEQTAAQLDLMIRQAPDYIKSTLSDEWHNSPWMSELSNTAARFETAVEDIRDATHLLRRTIITAIIMVLGMTVIFLLFLWAISIW